MRPTGGGQVFVTGSQKVEMPLLPGPSRLRLIAKYCVDTERQDDERQIFTGRQALVRNPLPLQPDPMLGWRYAGTPDHDFERPTAAGSSLSKNEHKFMLRAVEGAHAGVGLAPDAQILGCAVDWGRGGQHLGHVTPVHADVMDGAVHAERAPGASARVGTQ